MNCDCGSGLNYAQCCEPFHLGGKFPESPEALMRSRYSAYVRGLDAYLFETILPEARVGVKREEILEWSKSATWQGLKIIEAKGNQVEFIASYEMGGKKIEHHEVSQFRKLGGRWYFKDGEHHVHEDGQGHQHHAPMQPIVRDSPKVGRNDPCVCGSGKKYKKCCAA